MTAVVLPAISIKMKRILVGLSGGIDSAYTCRLLRERGYDIVGAVLDLHGVSPIDAAKDAAKKLDIPLVVVKRHDLFKEKVISYFAHEYTAGRTPNPCVVCNREVKVQALLDTADELGIEKVATGHYVKTGFEGGRYFIARGDDVKKDQSYFLWYLTQKQLSRLETPLGDFVKKDVVKAGEDIVKASESQEICFISDDDYISFLENKLKVKGKKGNFVTKDGKIIAPHRGIINYTVGQRKGLGVSLGKPAFVAKIDAESGDITLGEEGDIFSSNLTVKNVNFVSVSDFSDDEEFEVKIRYGAKLSLARVKRICDNCVSVEFAQPQRAVSPGQSAVFYKGDRVVFGGVIT